MKKKIKGGKRKNSGRKLKRKTKVVSLRVPAHLVGVIKLFKNKIIQDAEDYSRQKQKIAG